jgi:hypothetical protein
MKLIRYTTIILIFLAIGGCKDYLDVNTPINNPQAVNPQVLLGAGLIGTGFVNGNELNRFASTLIQYHAGAGNSPQNYDVYVTTGADFGNQWLGELYEGSLTEYQRLIETADGVGAKAYTGIAKIMKAYTFSVATDVWGDVPYSQALQGTTFLNPRLDAQKDIYEGNSSQGIQSLFDLVKEGLADLDLATTLTPGTDDVVYGGSIANWKKAANTLMLKFAIQISRVDPTFAKTQIDALVATNNFISSNAQTMGVKFGTATGSQSPIYVYNYVSSFRTDLIVSTRYLNRLQTALNNDPRLPLIVTRPNAVPPGVGTYVTMDNGFNGARPTPATSYSKWGPAITGVSGAGPVKLISNAQRAFMMAEAVQRLGVVAPKTANQYYQEGISASMDEIGVLASDQAAYFLANPTIVNLQPGTEIAQIIQQKYVALTGNGIEAWNDWRRTGFPTLTPSQNAAGIDGTIPVRAVYVNQELQRNPNFQNVNTNVRMWWDID